jgi:DNA-directed RNA polymerase specialized sigma24 family protein
MRAGRLGGIPFPCPPALLPKGGFPPVADPLNAPDKHAFVAGLATQYGRRLKQFLRLRLGNRSDVPDLAQEVFLRLLRVPNHEEIRSPEAYLFTIASHVVHQHHQKQSTAPASLDWVESFAGAKLSSGDDPTARTETA